MQRPSIGFSTASLAGMPLETVLRIGADLGMNCVEVLGFEGERHSQGDLCGFAFAERGEDEEESLSEWLEPFDHISVHAPFIQTPLLTNNPGIAREARRQILACIRGIARVGGSTCTVHLNPIPFRNNAEWNGQTIDLMRDLGDTAQQCGVTIALETGFPNAEQEYCGIIEDIDHPAVGACIDTGHIVQYYPGSMRGTADGVLRHNDLLNQIVACLGPKVAIFHCHDNRSTDFRDHRTPGSGIIDWVRLMKTLADFDVNAPMALELEEPDGSEAIAQGRACLEEAFTQSQSD